MDEERRQELYEEANFRAAMQIIEDYGDITEVPSEEEIAALYAQLELNAEFREAYTPEHLRQDLEIYAENNRKLL